MISTATAILIVSFIALMALRIEIAYCMLISTIATLLYLGLPLVVVFQGMVDGTNSFTFLCVPFFVLMGDLMAAGKVTDRIMEFAEALIGWARGGLAMVNCVASLLFGGVSGSAIADTASLGPIECDLMEKGGYDKGFAWGLTMATSIQGMLIPPSHTMILYAVTAGSVSIGALLIAGILPGVVLCISMCIYCYIVAVKNDIPIIGKFSLKKLWKATKVAFLPMLTFIIVVVGITGGVFTPTEAGCIACVYALILVVIIIRTIKPKQVVVLMAKTVKTLASIMILIAASNSFGWIIAYLGIPKMFTNALLTLSSNKNVLLLLSNILLLFLGMFMSLGSIVLIVTPILLPALMQVGVNPLHFGVIMILNCGIGLLTPPVGGVLYVGSGLSGMSIGALAKKMLPMYAVMVIALMIVTYVTQFSLWLPKVLIK